MFSKSLAMIVAMMLVTAGFSFQSVYAQSQSPKASETRAKVADMGMRTKVEVKLSDGTKVKGRIGEINNQVFTISDEKSGKSNEIKYDEVMSIEKSSGGLSPVTWGIIGGAAAAAVIVGITVVKPVLCDGGAGC